MQVDGLHQEQHPATGQWAELACMVRQPLISTRGQLAEAMQAHLQAGQVSKQHKSMYCTAELLRHPCKRTSLQGKLLGELLVVSSCV